MSRTRQKGRAVAPLVSVVEMRRPLMVYATEYAAGTRVPRHRHPVAQLIYASLGVMSVATDQGTWVVPPQRAVWVPPGVSHSIRMRGRVEMRSAYIEPELVRDAPDSCCVVQVPPLLRELLLRALTYDQARPPDSREERIA